MATYGTKGLDSPEAKPQGTVAAGKRWDQGRHGMTTDGTGHYCGEAQGTVAAGKRWGLGAP